MIRWIVFVGVAVVGLIVTALAWGTRLPVAHVAQVGRVVPGSPNEVWRAITDVRAFPEWRPDVDRVEVIGEDDGSVSWTERGSGGALSFETVERLPPQRLVTRILPEGQAFGGTWTYALRAQEGGTWVEIREDGEIYNPIFRVVARYLIGYEGTAERYLDALARRMEAGR